MFARSVAVVLALLALAKISVAADHEFRLEKSDAQSVSVAGEFNDWHAQPMAKQSDGVWSTKVALAPGTYGYKFLVNGSEWMFDPANSERKTVGGIENSSIEIKAGAESRVAVATPRPLASSTPTATVKSLSPTPGENLQVECPLSATEREAAAREGNAKLTTARLTISVPPGFDPAKSWPMLMINNTENYANSDSMNEFKQTANDAGWIILAADPIDAKKDDKGGWRVACTDAVLDYIDAAWPGAKDWPVACGGMSGGAKNSGVVAATVAKRHHHLIGMLMMGCNQDLASVAYRKQSPPQFLMVPIFLSSGKNDKIATPAHTDYVRDSMKATGFQKVRLESHDRAHDIYQPHITEALTWFIAEAKGSIKTPTPSAFDSFFKKQSK